VIKQIQIKGQREIQGSVQYFQLEDPCRFTEKVLFSNIQKFFVPQDWGHVCQSPVDRSAFGVSTTLFFMTTY